MNECPLRDCDLSSCSRRIRKGPPFLVDSPSGAPCGRGDAGTGKRKPARGGDVAAVAETGPACGRRAPSACVGGACVFDLIDDDAAGGVAAGERRRRR